MQPEAALPESPGRITLPEVSTLRCLAWIGRGWEDFRRAPRIALAHGLAMSAFGALLFALAGHRFWFLAGAFSGFLLVAPVLATGLYAVSRALERGERADFALVLDTWLSGDRRQMAFGFLLGLSGTGWVLTSASLITLLSPVAINGPADFFRHIVAAENWLFELWVVMGGLLAAPVFASSVIAMPMLLDRRTGVLAAVLTSWRVVLANPLPMAAWAAVILFSTALGMATLLAGLVVVLPLIGHASWHAYRDLVRDAP